MDHIFIHIYLPPASEGWGKVMFSVCSHPGGGGYTSKVPIPFPRLWSHVLSGMGVPHSLVPCPFWRATSDLAGGGRVPQSWPEGVPQDRGTPPARTGARPWQEWGTPSGQVMLPTVRLVRFPAGGLSCSPNLWVTSHI